MPATMFVEPAESVASEIVVAAVPVPRISGLERARVCDERT